MTTDALWHTLYSLRPPCITLFKSITMLCGTDNIIRNIPCIQIGCKEYSTKVCQSHVTMLWIWIILCLEEKSFVESNLWLIANGGMSQWLHVLNGKCIRGPRFLLPSVRVCVTLILEKWCIMNGPLVTGT